MKPIRPWGVLRRSSLAGRAAAVGLIGLLACAGLAGSARAKSTPKTSAIFEWSMPAQFGAKQDEQGRIEETDPAEVKTGPWRVDFKVTGRACQAGATYHWSVHIKGRYRPLRTTRVGYCLYQHWFPTQVVHQIRLQASIGRKALTGTQTVRVKNWLIVSIGDSVASGEGVPDVRGFGHATWQSERCHRSARSGTAKAALDIENDDPHSSVTFVHLACSGATIQHGLDGRYGGVENIANEQPLPPQVDVLNEIRAVRPIDAVLLSVGANDVHFGDIVRFCTAHPVGNCFSRKFKGVKGVDPNTSVAAAVASSRRTLRQNYIKLNRRISQKIPRSKIHIVEYFDPTRDANGDTCGRILSISRRNLEDAQSKVLEPLNRMIAAVAHRKGWDEVGGVAQLFRDHGYCAGKQKWITTLGSSIAGLGGRIKGRFLGTLHPNEDGHQHTSELIAASLQRSFFPGEVFGPHLPQPSHESGGGGLSALAIVGIVIGAVLLLPLAAVLLAVALIVAVLLIPVWVLLGLWAGREYGTLIVVGLALGVLITRYRALLAPGLAPFISLLKTVRPLLLPLLVVIVLGAFKFALAPQVLIAAAAIAVGWFLIIKPEAPASGAALHLELDALKTILKHAGVILAGGAFLALMLLWLILPTIEYFRNVGGLATFLLVLALAVWLVSIVLRFFSYATSRLRAVVATFFLLALLRLAIGAGLIPGDKTLHDFCSWMQTALIWVALGLLLLEAMLDVVISRQHVLRERGFSIPGFVHWIRGGGLSRKVTRDAAGFGFSTAASAAALLAISTIYALIATASPGHELTAPGGDKVHPEFAATPPGEVLSNIALAKTYAPVLAFTKDERWAPITADSYLTGAGRPPATPARLQGPLGKPHRVDTLAHLPRCPVGYPSCYTLEIPKCNTGQPKCSGAHRRKPGRLYHTDRTDPLGAVYVRVLRKGVPAKDGSHVFENVGPFRIEPRKDPAEELSILIQYWYFYRYDKWEAPAFAGVLTQQHQSDWEAVTVGLSDSKPLFVGYSAHCEGTWKTWLHSEVWGGFPRPWTHPLIAVARGSHANYPKADQRRSPDIGHCNGLPSGMTTLVSYASNIRDKTEYGWEWYPPRNGWRLVNANTPPMNFPGYWGPSDRTVLVNFKHSRLASGKGPLSPPLQELWQRPVNKIFCGNYSPHIPHFCPGE